MPRISQHPQPTHPLHGHTIQVQVYQEISVLVKLIQLETEELSYTYKTPKGCGGRHYASFSNHIDEAICHKHPDIYIQLYPPRIKA